MASVNASCHPIPCSNDSHQSLERPAAVAVSSAGRPVPVETRIHQLPSSAASRTTRGCSPSPPPALPLTPLTPVPTAANHPAPRARLVPHCLFPALDPQRIRQYGPRPQTPDPVTGSSWILDVGAPRTCT